MKNLNNIPTFVAPEDLSVVLRESFRPHLNKVNINAIKMQGDRVYILHIDKMSPLFSMGIHTLDIQSHDNLYSNRVEDIHKFVIALRKSNGGGGMFEAIQNLRRAYKDL